MKRIISIAAVLIVTVVAMIIQSCSKNNPVTPSVTISSIKPLNALEVYPMNGDTIIINGNEFGSSGSVTFPTSVTVSSANCLEWTATEIQVVIPPTAVAGNVYVTVGSNNSNLYPLVIQWPHYSAANGLADSI